jgi:FdhD protein
MNLITRYKDLALTQPQPIRVISRDSGQQLDQENVVTEHLLELYVNEVLTMKVVCTPEHLEELVLGRLLTEGIIRSVDDVERMYICEWGNRARVYLQDHATPSADYCPAVETTPSCCTGNRTLTDFFQNDDSLEPVKPIYWEPQWLFALSDVFQGDTTLHRQTSGTHCCMLAVGEKLLYTCEDLGRHNALDKVVGCALRDGVPLDQVLLYSSGRLPADMVLKAIRAGIPVLASKAVPTTEAIRLAKAYDLTLVGGVRPDRMRVFAEPETI